MTDQHLRLDIEYQQLEKFCNQLLSRSRDIAKTHESLITLETFIKVFGAGKQGSESYLAMESLVTRYTEQTRQQLLQQRTAELIQAMKGQNVVAMAAIHTPLSRNGFYLIAQAAVACMSRDEIQELQSWASTWVVAAKQKADERSHYPDAPDFKAAGIVLEEYLAMVDLNRYLASAGAS